MASDHLEKSSFGNRSERRAKKSEWTICAGQGASQCDSSQLAIYKHRSVVLLLLHQRQKRRRIPDQDVGVEANDTVVPIEPAEPGRIVQRSQRALLIALPRLDGDADAIALLHSRPAASAATSQMPRGYAPPSTAKPSSSPALLASHSSPSCRCRGRSYARHSGRCCAPGCGPSNSPESRRAEVMMA